MPAKSKSQQRFFGVVKGIQKGSSKGSGKAKKAARDMDPTDVDDFARTKHKGLPNKVKKETKVKRLIKKMVREIMAEDFGGAYSKDKQKKFDSARRKQSEVLGYTLTGKDDIKTEIGNVDKREYERHFKAIKEAVIKKLTEAVNAKEVEAYVKKKGLKDMDLPFWKVGIDYPFYPTKYHEVRAATAKEAEKQISRMYSRSSGGKVGKAVFDDSHFLKVNKNLKEGKLTEAHRPMSNDVAKEIIRQLGGNRFQSMTGAKKFIKDGKALFFKIGRNSKKINGIRIYYNSSDLYDIEFLRVSKNGIKVAKKLKNIYADQLQEIFTRYTGMYTAL